MSLTAFASSILNSYGSFTTPAFAPVLLNAAMIAGALWLTPYMDTPIMALGWSVVAAGFFQLAIQIPELWRKKLLIPPKIDFKHEGVDRIMKLMLPALFGVSVTQINLLLNTIWASYMQDGSVSWLYSAERMTELPLGMKQPVTGLNSMMLTVNFSCSQPRRKAESRLHSWTWRFPFATAKTGSATRQMQTTFCTSTWNSPSPCS